MNSSSTHSNHKRSPTTIESLKAIQQEVTAKVEELTSRQNWLDMLDVAARFPRYSFWNCMRILLQRPDATLVMPYGNRDGTTGWKSLGRHVKAGEKALYIRKPNTHWRKVEHHDGSEEKVEEFRPGRSKFVDVPVFDVSQTDGKPLPEVRPVLLEGDAPRELWVRLVSHLAANGWQVKLETPDYGNGTSDPVTHNVCIRPDMSPMQQLKTLLHEHHHIALGHTSDMREYAQHRGRMECEAESASYIVMRALDFDSSAYSIPYLASWAGGDSKVIAETAGRTVKAAHGTLSELGMVNTPDLAADQSIEMEIGHAVI